MNRRTLSNLSGAVLLTEAAIASYGQYAAPSDLSGVHPSGEVLESHVMSYEYILESLELAAQNVYTEDEEVQEQIGVVMFNMETFRHQLHSVPPNYPNLYQFFLSVVCPTVQQVSTFCVKNSRPLPRLTA